MSDLLTKHLRDWMEKHYKPSPVGYLFTNSNGKPYLSDNVVRYGVRRAMTKLGIETAKGVHVGIHCFRHGVTSELLESGTPIHVVTRLMRRADSKVTLEHYAHVIGDAERVAFKKFSQRIGRNINELESDPQLESEPQLESNCKVKTRVNKGLGGGVWESNPPFDPRRNESPALKAGKVTGLFSPPQ
jgi:hypothetical protein